MINSILREFVLLIQFIFFRIMNVCVHKEGPSVTHKVYILNFHSVFSVHCGKGTVVD